MLCVGRFSLMTVEICLRSNIINGELMGNYN